MTQTAPKPCILRAAQLPEGTVQELHERFTVLDLPADKSTIPDFLAAHGSRIRGMALRKTLVDAAFLDALPHLEIISSYSAGLENLDVEHALAKGIKVTNTSHILAEDVANTATALTLAVTRDLINADAFVRQGGWLKRPIYPFTRSITCMSVGIVGLGAIGSAAARRLEALGARVVYSGPRPKDTHLPYYADVTQMAKDCDLLLLCCPLSPQTHHLVNAEVLAALGPRGFLVNVSRGSIVDEQALIAALAANGIAGAALDVFENEPHVPQALIDDLRVVLTPHLGSGTEETRQAMTDNVVDELCAHLLPGQVFTRG